MLVQNRPSSVRLNGGHHLASFPWFSIWFGSGLWLGHFIILLIIHNIGSGWMFRVAVLPYGEPDIWQPGVRFLFRLIGSEDLPRRFKGLSVIKPTSVRHWNTESNIRLRYFFPPVTQLRSGQSLNSCLCFSAHTMWPLSVLALWAWPQPES